MSLSGTERMLGRRDRCIETFLPGSLSGYTSFNVICFPSRDTDHPTCMLQPSNLEESICQPFIMQQSSHEDQHMKNLMTRS